MLGINRKNGRLALAVLAGLGLAGVASQARADTILYQTGFGTGDGFGPTNTWTTNGQTVNGLSAAISNTASGAIVTAPTPTNNYGGTPNPAFSSQALQLTRTASNSTPGSVGVGPNLNGLGTPINTSTPVTISTSTYIDFLAPTGGGTGPFYGIDMFGNNNDGVNLGAFGVNAANGAIVYSPDGVNFFNANVFVGAGLYPLDAGGEYDKLSLVAQFTGGNGTDAGTINFLGYVDGTEVASWSSSAVSGVQNLSHTYLWDGELGANDISTGDTVNFGNLLITEAVPEPSTLALVGVCGMMLAMRRSRRSVAL